MALYQVTYRRLHRSILPAFFHFRLPPRAQKPMVSALSSLAATFRLSSQRRRSVPRTFPASGFDVIGQDQLVEEENIPEYISEHFYPVRLGEVFDGRFQTVAKLGYGSSSTIWLARDLQ